TEVASRVGLFGATTCDPIPNRTAGHQVADGAPWGVRGTRATGRAAFHWGRHRAIRHWGWHGATDRRSRRAAHILATPRRRTQDPPARHEDYPGSGHHETTPPLVNSPLPGEMLRIENSLRSLQVEIGNGQRPCQRERLGGPSRFQANA